MTLLCQNHSWKSRKQLLLLLFMILFLQKCSSRRVFVVIDPSYRQDFMDSSEKHAPSPVLSYHMQSKMHGPPSARYTVIITVTLVLLLVCALGMHFMIKCALKCSARRRRRRESMAETAALKEIKESKIEIGLLPVAVYCKLPWRPAAAATKPASPSAECAICLSEFRHGEKMRVLPHCSHGFHVVCIDAWLSAHSSCPTCRFDLNTMKGLRSDKIGNPDLSSLPTNPLFEW